MRIVGVDRVPSTPFDRGDAPRKPVLTTAQVRTRKAKRALAARGMVEAVTWSFISKPQAELFGGGQPELALANPIAAELSDMRPSLLPGLVAAAQKNADRGFPDVALFEVGQVFQRRQAGGSVHGGDRRAPRARQRRGRRPPLVGQDRRRSTRSTQRATRSPCWSQPARRRRRCRSFPAARRGSIPAAAARIQIGPQNVLGHFGELHPRALEALDAEGPLAAFEVILERIPEAKAKATRAKPMLELSPFQPVTRDFAFVVDRAVKAGDIVRAAQNVDRKLIAGVTVFDVYEGQGIEPGKKSIAIAVTIQPREKTMTDAEIDAVGAKIVAEVSKRTGGVLRG